MIGLASLKHACREFVPTFPKGSPPSLFPPALVTCPCLTDQPGPVQSRRDIVLRPPAGEGRLVTGRFGQPAAEGIVFADDLEEISDLIEPAVVPFPEEAAALATERTVRVAVSGPEGSGHRRPAGMGNPRKPRRLLPPSSPT